MAVKFFYSGMVSAPVLSGTAGATIGVLDACLKYGFGSKSVTSLVISGGVATMNVTGSHSAVVGATVLVAGATPSSLNGEKKVTAITGTSASFATTEADGSATGTITFKIAPLGFTTPFTGTNLRAYKSSSVDATGCVLRLDDTGTTTSRVVAYESMSDINTGVGTFPTSAQFSGGMYWPKSNAADSTSRPWVLIGDERAFIFYVAPNATYTTQGAVFGFGDILSNKSGDAYGCVLFGHTSTVNVEGSPIPGCLGYSPGTNPAFYGYIARDYTFLGGSQLVKKTSGANNGPGYSGTTNYNGNGLGYPNGPDNGLLVSPVDLLVGTNLRGRFPGIYHTPQNVGSALNTLDYIDGTGIFAGKRFMALRPGTTGDSSSGVMLVDVTGPWR